MEGNRHKTPEKKQEHTKKKRGKGEGRKGKERGEKCDAGDGEPSQKLREKEQRTIQNYIKNSAVVNEYARPIIRHRFSLENYQTATLRSHTHTHRKSNRQAEQQQAGRGYQIKSCHTTTYQHQTALPMDTHTHISFVKGPTRGGVFFQWIHTHVKRPGEAGGRGTNNRNPIVRTSRK